ncbi:hypothetical protein ACPER7_13995 [Acinetobacter dispersus]|uniref:hypothetical protein n=1 Tax=Acinetobacter dispersus TaxID=70348 RepID=UPI003C2C7BF1
MPTYKDFEDNIIALFQSSTSVVWKGVTYDYIQACKPSSQRGGECKTDVFVSLKSSTNANQKENIKISVKQPNADFYGNKLTADAALTLLGPDWKSVLIDSIKPLIQTFKSKTIAYTKPKKKPKDAYFTLGWKLEITDKIRSLSAPLLLNNQQIIDNVYRGINQPIGKKNAYVFGISEKDSGIADYLYKGSIKDTAQEILNNLIELSTYKSKPLYLTFTANNYRLVANKADGPRSLAIAIKWSHRDGKLDPTYIFDEPLSYKGEIHMQPHIKSALEALNSNDFATLDIDTIKP